MVRVTVQVKGLEGFAKNQIKLVQNLSARQLERIARDTETLIKRKINESIGRAGSTGNLANNMFAEPILNGWGIGNIRILNERAPYWRHVNFGSVAIGASHNHRVPQGAFSPGNPQPTAGGSGARWNTGQGEFSFVPGNPIAPLNYIAKTLAEVNRVISRGLREGI